VANYNNDAVSVINSSTNTVTATIPVGKNPSPFGLEFNPSNGYLYVVDQASDTVSLIDSFTNNITATIHVGDQPSSIKFNPSNDNMYVSNPDDDTVSDFNIA
jgi:YVTN family beta-propeller protein